MHIRIPVRSNIVRLTSYWVILLSWCYVQSMCARWVVSILCELAHAPTVYSHAVTSAMYFHFPVAWFIACLHFSLICLAKKPVGLTSIPFVACYLLALHLIWPFLCPHVTLLVTFSPIQAINSLIAREMLWLSTRSPISSTSMMSVPPWSFNWGVAWLPTPTNSSQP